MKAAKLHFLQLTLMLWPVCSSSHTPLVKNQKSLRASPQVFVLSSHWKILVYQHTYRLSIYAVFGPLKRGSGYPLIQISFKELHDSREDWNQTHPLPFHYRIISPHLWSRWFWATWSSQYITAGIGNLRPDICFGLQLPAWPEVRNDGGYSTAVSTGNHVACPCRIQLARQHKCVHILRHFTTWNRQYRNRNEPTLCTVRLIFHLPQYC